MMITTGSQVMANGCWIGHSWQSDVAGGINQYYAFRRKLIVPDEVKRAEVIVTADARYALWINGQLVNKGPLRCHPSRQSCDRIDVSPYFRKGENWFAVIVHQFGVTVHHHYVHRLRTGLMMHGVIDLANGECLKVGTDLSWNVRKADWYEGTQARVTAELGFQERFHAPKEPSGWRVGEDGDSAWRPVYFLGPVGIWPWLNLVERDIPYLQETPASGYLTYSAIGRNPLSIHAKDNLLHLLREERMERSTLPDLDDEGWVAVKLSGGEQESVVYGFDYSVIAAGYPVIEIREAEGASIVIDQYFSVIADEHQQPALMEGFGAENEGAAYRLTVADSTCMRVQDFSWEAFLLLGYRYHTVIIRGEGVIQMRVARKTVHYPVDLTGRFDTNDDTLPRIWEVSERTLRYGMLDIYADNVWREQGNWLHDMVVSSRSALTFYGDTRLARRSLLQFTQQVLPDESIYSVGPADYALMAISDYSFVWIDGVRWYYEQTGDHEFLAQCMPVVKGVLRWAKANLTLDGLFLSPQTHWHFIDWSEMEKKPYTLTIQLLMLQALDNAVWLADYGECTEQQEYAQWAAQLREAVASRFWDPEAGAWKEHAEPSAAVENSFRQRQQPIGWPVQERYKEVADYSIHANSLAILLRLGDSKQRGSTCAYLAKMANSVSHQVSPLWIDKYAAALFEGGESRMALHVVKRHYGNALERGLATWPEIWGDSDLSYESAFGGQTCGASIAWVLAKYVMGVSPAAIGWKQVRFSPMLGDLKWVKGTVPTPNGDISIYCEAGEEGLLATVSLPDGMGIEAAGQKLEENGSQIRYLLADR